MNTKILMVASTVFLGLAGIAASFAPDEVLRALGSPTSEPLPLLVQLLGATYFGFAIANWTAKANMIGGIYARPLSLGNAAHFFIGALALAKQQSAHGPDTRLMVLAIAYAVFAACFVWLVFGSAGIPRTDRTAR